MSGEEKDALGDPRMWEAAADVGRIPTWLGPHNPGQGTPLAFCYDRSSPEGGIVAQMDVYARDGGFTINRELSRLAMRAAWALGWPLPMSDRGLPSWCPIPDA